MASIQPVVTNPTIEQRLAAIETKTASWLKADWLKIVHMAGTVALAIKVFLGHL